MRRFSLGLAAAVAVLATLVVPPAVDTASAAEAPSMAPSTSPVPYAGIPNVVLDLPDGDRLALGSPNLKRVMLQRYDGATGAWSAPELLFRKRGLVCGDLDARTSAGAVAVILECERGRYYYEDQAPTDSVALYSADTLTWHRQKLTGEAYEEPGIAPGGGAAVWPIGQGRYVTWTAADGFTERRLRARGEEYTLTAVISDTAAVSYAYGAPLRSARRLRAGGAHPHRRRSGRPPGGAAGRPGVLGHRAGQRRRRHAARRRPRLGGVPDDHLPAGADRALRGHRDRAEHGPGPGGLRRGRPARQRLPHRAGSAAPLAGLSGPAALPRADLRPGRPAVGPAQRGLREPAEVHLGRHRPGREPRRDRGRPRLRRAPGAGHDRRRDLAVVPARPAPPRHLHGPCLRRGARPDVHDHPVPRPWCGPAPAAGHRPVQPRRPERPGLRRPARRARAAPRLADRLLRLRAERLGAGPVRRRPPTGRRRLPPDPDAVYDDPVDYYVGGRRGGYDASVTFVAGRWRVDTTAYWAY